MLCNQFGRRNLTDYVRAELALKLKAVVETRARARQQGGQGGTLLCPNSDKASPVHTDKELAKMAGMGKDSLRKVAAPRAGAPPDAPLPTEPRL